MVLVAMMGVTLVCGIVSTGIFHEMSQQHLSELQHTWKRVLNRQRLASKGNRGEMDMNLAATKPGHGSDAGFESIMLRECD